MKSERPPGSQGTIVECHLRLDTGNQVTLAGFSFNGDGVYRLSWARPERPAHRLELASILRSLGNHIASRGEDAERQEAISKFQSNDPNVEERIQ